MILVAAPAHAQRFDVASVKVSGPQSVRGSEGGPGSKDPTRYTFGKADLGILLMIAYDVDSFQISSKIPLNREEIDISAAIPAGATKEQFRIMLKNLLIERFRLQAHTESREFPGYGLVVAKAGAKLKPAAHPAEPIPAAWKQDGFPEIPADRPTLTFNNRVSAGGYFLTRVKGQQQPVSRLADMLKIGVDLPVVDQTGIQGDFDFLLEFSKDSMSASISSTAEPAGAPELRTALREQLGLELVKQRLAFPVVIVDAVDRLPTGN